MEGVLQKALILGGMTALLFSSTGVAQEDPTTQVKATVDRVLAILGDPALKDPAKQEAQRKRLREAIYPRFDFAEMAKRSLGPHWRDRTPQEREEFERLFADLLERSYYEKLHAYTDQEIRYANEEVDGKLAVVRTKIVSEAEKSEIPVDYKLVRHNGQWKVYDLTIEGVSLVSNYRTQFNRIIQTSSYAELVRKMRAKHEDEGFSPAPGRHR